MNQPPVILVLVVDDEAAFREIFSAKLAAAGFKVETASGGAEGLKKAKEIKPDLILMDVRMPDMDGVEALTRLQADPTTKGAKVVFLTNIGEPRPQAADVDAHLSTQIGAMGYIRKTDDLDEIIKKIKGYLDK
ncbi:MAG: response regulator [Patescibacteria group bacterium]